MEDIKASDIMLGNWFQVNGFLMYIDAIYSDMVSLDFKGNEGGSWEEYTKDLVPIPLTEEMLLKCGAKKIEDEHVYLMLNDASTHLILMKSGEYWYPSIEQTPEFSVLDSNIISLERIGSVHELQNLYKVLAKTDLDINLWKN